MAQIGFITIGLPFSAFKLIFGLSLVHTFPGSALMALGICLIALGAADLCVNLSNSVSLWARRRPWTKVCVLAIGFSALGKNLNRAQSRFFSAEFGTALDTMLAFSLVAIVVGFNFMRFFGENERLIWNLSVVVNVLGAGASRLLLSVSSQRSNAANGLSDG